MAQLNNQNKEIDRQLQVETRKAVDHLRGQYQTAMQRETMLREALQKQKQEANQLNESAIEYSQLKRDVETYRWTACALRTVASCQTWKRSR